MFLSTYAGLQIAGATEGWHVHAPIGDSSVPLFARWQVATLAALLVWPMAFAASLSAVERARRWVAILLRLAIAAVGAVAVFFP